MDGRVKEGVRECIVAALCVLWTLTCFAYFQAGDIFCGVPVFKQHVVQGLGGDNGAARWATLALVPAAAS